LKRRDEVSIFFDASACPLPTVIPHVKFDPGRTIQMETIKNG
jgi:hypothetical protein